MTILIKFALALERTYGTTFRWHDEDLCRCTKRQNTGLMVMGFLDKILGSDRDLTRPDFSTSPLIKVDFSGNKISFIDPPQTAMFPINDWPEDMDIFDEKLFYKAETGELAKRFYVKGWNLDGSNKKSKGAVIATGFTLYYPQDIFSSQNSFEKNTFEHCMLSYCHIKWGFQNESKELGDPGNGTFIYPFDNTTLKYVNKNNTTWCYFTSQIKGKPPIVVYAYPISSTHIIVLEFTLSAYQGLDFYSPETNLEQVSFEVIDAFMDHFSIELSDASKQQQSATKDPLPS